MQMIAISIVKNRPIIFNNWTNMDLQAQYGKQDRYVHVQYSFFFAYGVFYKFKLYSLVFVILIIHQYWCHTVYLSNWPRIISLDKSYWALKSRVFGLIGHVCQFIIHLSSTKAVPWHNTGKFIKTICSPIIPILHVRSFQINVSRETVNTINILHFLHLQRYVLCYIRNIFFFIILVVCCCVYLLLFYVFVTVCLLLFFFGGCFVLFCLCFVSIFVLCFHFNAYLEFRFLCSSCWYYKQVCCSGWWWWFHLLLVIKT